MEQDQEQKSSDIVIDRFSFQLGMINCFVEMVACGVKKLALSPPLLPADYEKIETASNRLVESFQIKSYLEKSLLVTGLQTADFTRGKWSILYYADDEVLEQYLELKREQEEMEKDGLYDDAAQDEVSREFMRLLSYPGENIEDILSRDHPKSPFMLID